MHRLTRVRHRFAVQLGALAAISLAIRVGYVLIVAPRITMGLDAVWYQLQAVNIATGTGYFQPAPLFSTPSIPTATFPPLWPTLLAGLHLVDLTTPTGYRLAGAVIGTGTVVLTGLLGRRVAGPRVGVIAAAIAAVSPFLIASDASLMSDGLFTFLVTAALLVAVGIARRPTVVGWIVLGGLLGFAALTRGDGLIVAPFVVVATAWRVHGSSRSARVVGVIVTAATMVVVLTPWTIRNSVRLDSPVVLSTNSSGVLEGANCDSAYSGPEIGLWSVACLRVDRSPGVTEAAASREAYRVGLQYARDHAVRLAAVVVPVRVLRGWGFWNPVSQARAEAVESRSVPWQVVGWGVSFATILLAGVGVRTLVRRGVDVTVLVALLVGVTVEFAVSWGNQRFRLAAEPVLAVFAASFLATLRPDHHRRSRHGRPGSGVGEPEVDPVDDRGEVVGR